MFRFMNPILMTPKQAIRLGKQSTLMMAEAHRVIVMRVAGMAGVWNVIPSEHSRMVHEKSAIAVASATAMARAIASGASPATVALAGLKPVRAKTKANASRLAKRGPKLPKIL